MPIGLQLAALGDKGRAFEWLERAYTDRFYQWVRDPRLDPLRDDPRYDRLLRRMNLSP